MNRLLLLAIVVATVAVATVFGFVVRGQNSATAQIEQGICGPMDVAFLIDDTGSMGGAIANIQAAAASIIADIDAASAGDDQLALLTFKDNVTVRDDLALGNDASVLANIAALVASGGAGLPEASDEAINTVVNGLDAADRLPGQQIGDFNGAFRAAAVKIIILITDAPPGGFDDTFTLGVDDVNADTRADEAAAAGIKISAIFVPTGGDYAGQAAIMMNYATVTGGQFVQTAANGDGTAAAITNIIEQCGRGDTCIDHLTGERLRWCSQEDAITGPAPTPTPEPEPLAAPVRRRR